VKSVDGAEVRQLTTHPGFDFDPAWSRDGRLIAFRRLDKGHSEIYMIPVAGGAERKLTETVRPPGVGVSLRDWKTGMSWSSDGRHLLAIDAGRNRPAYAIIDVSTITGEKRILTSPPPNFIDMIPVFSSDDRSFAFVRARTTNPSLTSIYIQSLDAAMNPKGEARVLHDVGSSTMGLAWTPSRKFLVFAARSQCWSVPVVGGNARPLGGVCQSPSSLTVAPKENRLAYTRVPNPDENIYRLPLPVPGGRGNPAKLFVSSPEADYSAEFSPDGKKVALVSARSKYLEIWVCSATGSDCRQITSARGPEVGSPKWSPDGHRIAFDFDQNGHIEIYTVNADGGEMQRLTTAQSNQARPNWSADGRWIYFGSNQQDDWQIWKMPSKGGIASRITRHGGFEAAESSDGQFVYYNKRRLPGIWRVPAGGGEEVRTTDIGDEGQWTLVPDGIFLLTREPARGFVLEHYSFATRRISEVVRFPSSVISLIYNELEPSLSISPDRHSVLFAQMDHADTEIMLVEGFRE
jgi:Tol biopolymer transport system component